MVNGIRDTASGVLDIRTETDKTSEEDTAETDYIHVAILLVLENDKLLKVDIVIETEEGEITDIRINVVNIEDVPIHRLITIGMDDDMDYEANVRPIL